MFQLYHGESEWLLLNANSAIFQLYHGYIQWNDGDVRFVLNKHA
jgi:hypothetical protein